MAAAPSVCFYSYAISDLGTSEFPEGELKDFRAEVQEESRDKRILALTPRPSSNPSSVTQQFNFCPVSLATLSNCPSEAPHLGRG